METISRHIMPLVINSLGADTHKQIHTHTHTDDPHRINFKKPGACRPVRAWFIESINLNF